MHNSRHLPWLLTLQVGFLVFVSDFLFFAFLPLPPIILNEGPFSHPQNQESGPLGITHFILGSSYEDWVRSHILLTGVHFGQTLLGISYLTDNNFSWYSQKTYLHFYRSFQLFPVAESSGRAMGKANSRLFFKILQILLFANINYSKNSFLSPYYILISVLLGVKIQLWVKMDSFLW